MCSCVLLVERGSLGCEWVSSGLINECVPIGVFCCCGEGVSMLNYASEEYVYDEVSI